MKTMILIRGLSGSGKTMLADLLQGNLDGRADITVDEFFTTTSGYNFQVEKLKDAHEWCKEETEKLLQDEWEAVIVHNTFTRKWEVDPYIEMGTKHGYRIQVINLYDAGLNDKELSERCAHNVSPSTISRQRKRWEKDVFRERSHHHPQYPYYPPHYHPHPPQYHQPQYHQPQYHQPQYHQPQYPRPYRHGDKT